MAASTDILILHYNRPDLTAKCIEGCLAVGDEWRHLFVVDNGSDEPLPNHPSSRVTVLRSEENLGFSGGVNVGMAHVDAGPAAGVLLLNNDALLTPGYIAALATFGLGREDAWACCGTGFGDDESGEQPTEVPTPLSPVVPFFNLPWQQSIDVVPNEPTVVEWATAAALWIKREAWERLGPWRESFFLYWEDVDFGWRVNAAGGSVWHLPEARYVHIGSATSSGRRPRLQYYYYRNHLRFWSLHDRSRLGAIVRWHLRRGVRDHQPTWENWARWFAVRDWLLRRTGPIPARVDKKLAEVAGRE